MERYRKQSFENFQDENFSSDAEYELACKQVERIKEFYVHVLVYVVVNILLIAYSYYSGNLGSEIFFRLETFCIPFFWGLGLLVNGLSVFCRNLFLGIYWEEKKIREFMDKDKRQKFE